MGGELRLLVLDGYARDGRDQLRAAGATEAGRLYAATLSGLAPDAQIDIAHPADEDGCLARGTSIGDYDGVAWTGSSLVIHRADDPHVTRQVEMQRAVFESGVPSFGSCWAIQVATVAAGGECGPNPRGREFGLGRKIRLSSDGERHPVYAGKPAVFDALTSHGDEVTRLPPDATLLASNAFSRVQAAEIRHSRGVFWGVQYHPEYDLHEVARLCTLRAPGLVEQGTFRDLDAATAWIDLLETLHDDPSRGDIAWQLGIDDDVLDPDIRLAEVRNWIEHQVRPRA